VDGRAITRSLTMSSKSTVKLNKSLCDRASMLVSKAGYSSLEEFIEHAMEKDLARLEEADSKEDLIKKLKGLGYLE
jgi:Arc/MetJ-type ribon-helix-helix transcriptional regulator